MQCWTGLCGETIVLVHRVYDNFVFAVVWDSVIILQFCNGQYDCMMYLYIVT
jgi:hypothetical protein